MFTSEEIGEIELLIQNSKILNEEKKDVLASHLKNDEPYDEAFINALGLFLDAQFGSLTIEQEKLGEELVNVGKKLENAKNELQKKSHQITEELPEYFEKEENKTIEEMKDCASSFDTEVEKIVHEEGEQSEIDAIRNQLQS